MRALFQASRIGLGLLSALAILPIFAVGSSVGADDRPSLRRLEVIGLLRTHDFDRITARLTKQGQVLDGYANLFSYSDPALESDLDAWVEARPDQALPYLARATYLEHIAGLRRGSNYSRDTHPAQFAAMRHYQELAVRDYRRALDLDHGTGEAYASLIHIAFSISDRASAERLRQEGLDKARNTFPVHMAIIDKLQPKWGSSREELRAYISNLLDHDLTGQFEFLKGYLDDERARQLYSEKKYEEALQYNERAFKTGETPGRYHRKARILLAQSKAAEALVATDKAVQIQPDWHENYTLRAAIHREIGDLSAAYNDASYALALDPYNPGLLARRADYFLVEAHMLPSDAPSADYAAISESQLEHLQRALVHGQFNAAVHKKLAEYYTWSPENRDRSIEHFYRSVELMPHVPDYWGAFSEALLRFQDCRAVETARQYLKVCNAERDCTPNMNLVRTIETNLASCQAPQMSGNVELPLAPKLVGELQQLLRCGTLFGEQDDASAVRACLALADANDADAQFDMGMLYIFSGSQLTIRGAEDAHIASAIEWLNKAHAQDHTRAMAVLGSMYLHGVGVARDLELALGLLSRAAERDDTQALMGLAMAYQHAVGVTKDISKAEQYYRRAAALGSQEAASALTRLQDEKG